ncbi:DUF5615 family PIN-like protein [Synechococcus sp. R50.1]|uniref:DUF5615 family PIN-like protein n=1 Tax=Synechococcus sp. R50.1 TaxID=2969649 RepID=UPI0039C21273
MQFLVNENFPRLSICLLRDAGLDVASLSEEAPGTKDFEVLARAAQEKRIILTFDRDYGELIFRYSSRERASVVYFRYQPSTPEEPAQQLLKLVGDKNLVLEGMFTVIERNQVRQRPL